MTGYQSKKAAALDEEGMYLVHHTQPTSLNGYIKKIEDLIQERDTWKAAAQRPWVGLAPDEILNLFDLNNVYGSKWVEFARAVETKLKELNT